MAGIECKLNPFSGVSTNNAHSQKGIPLCSTQSASIGGLNPDSVRIWNPVLCGLLTTKHVKWLVLLGPSRRQATDYRGRQPAPDMQAVLGHLYVPWSSALEEVCTHAQAG